MKTPANRWPGQSWYEVEAAARTWPVLAGSVRAEVAIVGAGLAGISTALELIEKGCRGVVVVDALEPGGGASGRNGGFVFAGYSLAGDALLAQVGRERAARMHGWTRDAVAGVRARIDRYAIDCQVSDAGVLLADWFDEPEVLSAWAGRMKRDLGFDLEPVDRVAMAAYVRSARYGGGLLEPGSFHFHPLRYIRGLADAILAGGGQVFGQSPVGGIRRQGTGWCIECPQGQIIADEVVLATGGYDRRLVPTVQRALQPVATYVAVTEPLGERLDAFLPGGVAVYDTRFAFDYYRPLPDSRLLWGGRISMAARSPGAIRRLMRHDLERVFPGLSDVRFDHAWGGWMSYARHEMPLLGRTSEGHWHALAFGGHGMAPTTLAGAILAEALTGKPERLDEFSDWPPRWAGGMAGRLVGQAIYWRAQLRDALKDRRLRSKQHDF
jgi:gamma-glutamylputrescine oxidase